MSSAAGGSDEDQLSRVMPRRSDPNHASADEILQIGEPDARRSGRNPPASPPPAQVRPALRDRAADDEVEETRLHTHEAKLAIFKAYLEWTTAGKKRGDSPIDALVEEWNCERTYPKKLYDKVAETGSVDNAFSGGRPPAFSPECWESMVQLIRDARKKQTKAS